MNQVVLIESISEYSKALADDLKEYGLSVVSFASEKEYFKSPFYRQIGIILIGLSPTSDGIEMTGRIREFDQISPIILISEDYSEKTEIEASAAGVDFYFKKSFGRKILKLVVRNNHRRICALIEECMKEFQ